MEVTEKKQTNYGENRKIRKMKNCSKNSNNENSIINQKSKFIKSNITLIIALFAIIVTGILGYNFFFKENTVKFGTYNGQSIEWMVLDEKEDGSKLLLSKYVLLTNVYNEEWTSVTWETCTLRNWLNNDFYQESFTNSEQNKIQTTKVVNKNNEEYGTDGGNDTEDKVFLLSIDEVNQYFDSDEDRIARRSNDNDTWWYRLRSPGYGTLYAAFVSHDGVVNEYGLYKVCNTYWVRPALWVNL